MPIFNFARRIIDPLVKPWGTKAFASFWTPANITTALWLDAADSDTITLVSGAVSEWADKSGNNRHATQGTAASRPTVSAFGTMDVLSFDGVDDFLTTSFTNPTSAYDFFDVVIRGESVDGADNLGGIYGFQVSQSRLIYGIRDNSNLWMGAGSTSLANVTKSTNSGAYIFNYRLTSTTAAQLWVDGSSVHTISAFTGGAGGSDHTVGSGGGTGNLFGPVSIAERIVLPLASLEDRQLIEGYLAHKWGLTENLSVDHPYKDVAPRA